MSFVRNATFPTDISHQMINIRVTIIKVPNILSNYFSSVDYKNVETKLDECRHPRFICVFHLQDVSERRTDEKGWCHVAVLLYVCSVEGFTNPSEKIKQATSEVEDVIKGLQKESNINTNTVGKAPTDERGGGMMGPKMPGHQSQMPYDGLCLKTGNTEYWMKPPDDEPLMSNDKLYTYLGSTGPIKMRLSEQSALIGLSRRWRRRFIPKRCLCLQITKAVPRAVGFVVFNEYRMRLHD